MADGLYEEFAKLVALEKRGSVVAAAGCGKTEQIALATKFSEGRKLILTHTHAGVDVLRTRLKRHAVPRDRFHIDTIAGWCLRYAASFPKRSGLTSVEPSSDDDWKGVYKAAVRLLTGGSVSGVVGASYSGLLVDEYQDCSALQHEVIKALAAELSTCVFGDPLQAIFDFKGQKPCDWETEVFPYFKQVGELKEPWRWLLAGNGPLADWLAKVREDLWGGRPLDLNGSPDCVSWVKLSDDPRFRTAGVVGACKTAMGEAGEGSLVVIGDAGNINARAALAQQLAKSGFSNIEPVSCQHLYDAAKSIEENGGGEQLDAAMEFVAACMTGTEKTEFLKAVQSHQKGRKRGAIRFGDLIDLGLQVADGGGPAAVTALLEGFSKWDATRTYRREMFSAMRSALRIRSQRDDCSLADAVWEVQNCLRHAGRIVGRRSIGSTLLVKGLEFDHAVIVHSANMTRKDWYVALTRATSRVTVISPRRELK